MYANNRPTEQFSDMLSLNLRATLIAVIILISTLVLPDQISEISSGLAATSQTLSSAASNNSNLQSETSSLPIDLKKVQTFSELLTHYSSRFHRFSALYELTNRLDEDDLVTLIDEIKDFEYDATNQTWKSDSLLVVISKLVHVDADKVNSIFFALSEDTQRDLAYGIANEWSFLDLEGATNFVSSFSDSELKMISSNGVLDAQSSLLSMDELTVLAQQFENEEYIADLIEQNLFIEEAKHPERSWNEITKDPSLLTHENVRRLLNVAEAWVHQIGVSAIPKVTEVVKDQNLRLTMQSRLLRVAALQDAESAFEYAITVTGSRYSRPANPVLSIWAEQDPHAAWERLSVMDSTDERKELIQTLLASWGGNDSQSLMESLGDFPKDVQDAARVTLIFNLIKESTDAALAMYDDIEDKSSKLAAARTLAYDWGSRDGEAALSWVLTDPSTEPERKHLARTILGQMTQQDFQNAFNVARNQPLGVDGNEEIGLEATVLNILSFRNLDNAVELLPLVREGPTKLEAYREVGDALAKNDRLDEAIANGKEFTGEDQVLYYTRIGFNVNVMEDPKSIFAMLDKLPSETARSRIATTQLSNNQQSNVYDDDQIERLKEYLTNEDRELLKKIEAEGIRVPDSYTGY